MSRTFRYAFGWLVALWVVTGLPSELAAQRAPTIAAAANLNFALDRDREAVRAHAGRPRRAGVRRIRHLDAADPGRRAVRDVPGRRRGVSESARRGRPDARCRRGVRRRPSGDLRAQGLAARRSMNGSTVSRRLVKAGGAGRFAIANPEVAPYGRAAEAVLRKRGLWDALAPEPRARRQHRAGRAVRHHRERGGRPHRLFPRARPGLRRPRHLCRDSRRPIIRRFASAWCCSSGPARSPHGSTPISRADARARDSPETRLRGARIAVHGLDGAPRLAVARRRHHRDSAPVRHLVRASAGGPPLPRQAAGRGAGHGAARAAAHGARVLPPRHLWRALAARSRPFRPSSASRCRSRSRGCCSRPPSRTFRSSSSRSSAASKRSRPTCAMPPPAAA